MSGLGLATEKSTRAENITVVKDFLGNRKDEQEMRLGIRLEESLDQQAQCESSWFGQSGRRDISVHVRWAEVEAKDWKSVSLPCANVLCEQGSFEGCQWEWRICEELIPIYRTMGSHYMIWA